MDHCFHNNGNLIFKIHALGDDSQLSRIRRRFKEQSGLIPPQNIPPIGERPAMERF